MTKKIIFSPFSIPAFFLLAWTIVFCIVYFNFDFSNIIGLKEAEALLGTEKPTHILYALMLGTVFLSAKFFYREKKLKYWLIYFVFSALAFLRALGLHKSLASVDTTPFKSRFFLNPNNPVDEKIIAGFILLIVFGGVLWLAVKYSKHLILSFFKMNTTTWSLATFFTALVLSQIFDRFRSQYYHLTGTKLDMQTSVVLIMLEETMEIFLPLLIILIIAQYYLIRKSAETKGN